MTIGSVHNTEPVAVVCCGDWHDVEANTAYIIRCVNGHEMLLEAAKAVVDAWHDDDCNYIRGMEEYTPEWLAKCRAAIQAAEGGSDERTTTTQESR